MRFGADMSELRWDSTWDDCGPRRLIWMWWRWIQAKDSLEPCVCVRKDDRDIPPQVYGEYIVTSGNWERVKADLRSLSRLQLCIRPENLDMWCKFF